MLVLRHAMVKGLLRFRLCTVAYRPYPRNSREERITLVNGSFTYNPKQALSGRPH